MSLDRDDIARIMRADGPKAETPKSGGRADSGPSRLEEWWAEHKIDVQMWALVAAWAAFMCICIFSSHKFPGAAR